MRARIPPPSTWRLWHPRNGVNFASPQTQEMPSQQRPQPQNPDLSGHRSFCITTSASSVETANASSVSQFEVVGTKQEGGITTAPHVLQAATQPYLGETVLTAISSEAEVMHGKTETVAAAELEAGVPPSTALDFKIDVELFRAAKRARAGSPNSYWSYDLYRGPQGEKVKVHYCRSKHTAERACQLFLGEKVVGFDMEWLSDAKIYSGARRNVCLVQLASQSRVALFHIALYPKEDSLVAPSLRRLMEDPEVSKVGVNIKGDCTRLRNWLGINSRGIFELSHLYKLVKYSASGETHLINRRSVSLAEQVKAVLGLPMFKGTDVRSSDWTKPLKMDQITYSASDAFAGPQIYHILEQQRKALQPTPPRPYHAELGLPIRVADGQAAVAAEEEGAEDLEPEVNKVAPQILSE